MVNNFISPPRFQGGKLQLVSQKNPPKTSGDFLISG
jgi:hypothetical protein